MADIADIGNDRAQEILSDSLAALRRKKPEAEHTGECLFCGAKVDHPKRWCDADCRDGWEKEKAAARRAPPLV